MSEQAFWDWLRGNSDSARAAVDASAIDKAIVAAKIAFEAGHALGTSEALDAVDAVLSRRSKRREMSNG